MARQNVSLLSFNRGVIGAKSLARVDLDRTRLSADTMVNWIPSTQGSMSLRPGTQYKGGLRNDTGAYAIEFIASTNDVALLEVTGDTGTELCVMRIRLGSDPHNLSLLERPNVSTTISISDTGWVDTSLGGSLVIDPSDAIPAMSDYTTNGVTISASSENVELKIFGSVIFGTTGRAWEAADDVVFSGILGGYWRDTGEDGSALPSWWNVDFGSGNPKAISSYSIQAATSSFLANAPNSWELLAGNHDTGTFAIDTGKWTLVDARSSETSWSSNETRTFTRPDADTGTVEANRHYRLYFTAADGDTELVVAQIQMFTAASDSQVAFGNTGVLNATAIGSLARAEKRVVVSSSDEGVEHSLNIEVSRGPITLRVGSSQRDDDYVTETSLGTGVHNLAFTPNNDFWVTLQTDDNVSRIINSLAIGDTGTVEIKAPWGASDLDNIRFDQSADVVFVDCAGVKPQKIERRGTGRSWSVVDYAPDDGPFLSAPSSSANLSVSHFYGNTTLNSDIPIFTSAHVGSLIRIFHEGQSGQWALGNLDAKTDAVEVTGVGDTGTAGATNERRITVAVSGTFSGTVTVERSFDGPEIGFKPITANIGDSTLSSGQSDTYDDTEDNIQVWYRARVTSYTSGVAIVTITYGGGGVTGRGRITRYNSNTSVDLEVISRFSDTGQSDNWQFGYWSDARGFPTAVALHGGRLAHAQGGSLFLSASDDFENFDQDIEGDAAPIIRTIGSGPVDNIHYLVSVLRLLVGTAGAELTVKSSSLDEPLTPSNSSIVSFSTQGSKNVRAVKLDTRAIMVQRSGQRIFMIGPAQNTLSDYESFELTLLVPELLAAGVVSVAVQRQPDTRIWCVLEDGTAGILTYEPNEEVIAWSTFESDTGTSPQIERVMVLPGAEEDAVYLHVRRTINGSDKRYLEKLAKESECLGDTGLSYLMDCAVSFAADTGRATSFADAATHLAGESVVAWGDLDSGLTPFVDLSPGFGSLQTRHTVDTGGDLTLTGLTDGVSQGVVGLPYSATWKSSKLAYAAEMGSALGQVKRVPQASLILYKTHHKGIQFGARDTGNLDGLGKVDGKTIDVDVIHETLDSVSVPVPATYETDPRLIIRGQSPRPVTLLAVVPTISTNER